jgi:hypothetical protein
MKINVISVPFVFDPFSSLDGREPTAAAELGPGFGFRILGI